MEGSLELYSYPSLSISNCVTLKLTDRNYILWKSQFESFLSSQSLLGFVDGSATKPLTTIIVPDISGDSSEIKNPDFQAWFRSDQLVRSWLLGSLSEDVLSLVIGCNTSYEVWTALSTHFNRVSSSRLFELQRRLQTMSMQNKPVAEYLRDFKAVCDQLNSIGHPVPEQMKIFGVLQGLGREYESFTTVIESSMDAHPGPTYEDVISRLKGFDDRLKSYAATPDVSPHLAFNTTRFNNSYSPSFRGRGDYSPRRGHFRGRTSYSTRGRGFHQQLNTRPLFPRGPPGQDYSCQICGRLGHTALRCWNRFDNNYQFDEPPSALAAVRLTDVTDYQGQEWFSDTGANAHVTSTQKNLQQSQPYIGTDSVMVGDGNFLPITHVGTASLPSSSGTLTLQEVLVCPTIKKSLLSVSKLTSDYPCMFEFDAHGVCVKDKETKRLLTTGRNRNGLYVLEDDSFLAFYSTRQQTASDEVWHRRLGHPNPQILQDLASKKAISINKFSNYVCEPCRLAKSMQLPFLPSKYVAEKPLERVHCDLWGPSPVDSIQGFRFYVIFVDHYSRYSWFYPLRHKSDFFSTFLKFQAMVENQLKNRIGVFQCDGGGEFTSNRFLTHLQTCGIIQHISCPHTAQQNGLAERKHRHLTELGLSMLFQAKLPQKYWLEAFFTANFLSNLLPSSTTEAHVSAYERLNGTAPEYKSLRTFGCACFPNLRDYAIHKLDPRSLKCVFLGYNENYKGYRCIYPPTGRVYLSRSVVFDEADFPFLSTYQHLQESSATGLYGAWKLSFPQNTHVQPENGSTSSSPDVIFQHRQLIPPIAINSPSNSASPDTNQQVSLRTLTSRTEIPTEQNTQHQTSNKHTMVTRAKAGIRKPNPRYILFSQKVSYPEPKTVAAAKRDPGWKAAMQEELDSLSQTQTWTLVPYEKGMNVVGSKWVFKTKLKANGSLDKLRARLVAKGFHQEEEIDYLETFSPVIKTATVRIVLHLATIMQWDIKQLDVKNAFLHGDLAETVFMTQPAGFSDPSLPNHVCHLHKSIYGLKQSPRAWFNKFSNYLLEYGFVCSKADPSLFIFQQNSDILLLLLYVDDMLLTGNSSSLISRLIQDLGTHFSMKDLGKLQYFLGIQALFHSKGLFLSQNKYAEDLLILAGMDECSPMPTPLPIQLDRLEGHDRLFSDPTYFRSLAGKLQYLTLTRPDIQFSVNYICQKMHSPSVSDFTLLKRILRYVKGTVKHGISLSKDSDCMLSGYSDSDWAGCKESRRSTGGYCTFLGNNIISWSAKKQPTVSRSSTEAEYRALASTAAEITWISSVLRDLSIPQLSPAAVYCDNLSSVYLTANPILHARTKHIDVDYHYVREKVALGSLEVKHISADLQLADIFTKSLGQAPFMFLRYNLGVDSPPPSSLRGDVSRSTSTLQEEEEKQSINNRRLQKGKYIEVMDQDKCVWAQKQNQPIKINEPRQQQAHMLRSDFVHTRDKNRDDAEMKTVRTMIPFDKHNRFDVLGIDKEYSCSNRCRHNSGRTLV